MSWSAGWKNIQKSSRKDNKDSSSKAKHLSIFGHTFKKNSTRKSDELQSDFYAKENSGNVTSQSWKGVTRPISTASMDTNSTNKSEALYDDSFSTIKNSNLPSIEEDSSNISHVSRNIIMKEGFLSKRTDLIYGASLSSALGRGWKVYKVVLRGAKLFFYKPPSESALKAVFSEDPVESYSKNSEFSKSGMPLTQDEIDSNARSTLFDPVVSDGIIQKPLCERYIFGECFTEVSSSNMKFKRYMCLLIFDDKIVILKRKWVKEGRASSFFIAVGNKMRFNKKNSILNIKDNSSIVSARLGIKGKGYFTKWKEHSIYKIKDVEVMTDSSSKSNNSLFHGTFKSVNSSRSSLYSVGNQSISSINTHSSTVSKDYSGVISNGAAPSFQLIFSSNQSVLKTFVATSVDAKNNWLARFAVAKASYNRVIRQNLREKARHSTIWNDNPTINISGIKERTTSKNIGATYLNLSKNNEATLSQGLEKKIKQPILPASAEFAFGEKSKEELHMISHKDSVNSNIEQPLSVKNTSTEYFSIELHPDLTIVSGTVVGGTLESLVHEAIFSNTVENVIPSHFTSILVATYPRYMKTETFVFYLEKFVKLIDTENINHTRYIENIFTIIDYISNQQQMQYSKLEICIFESILNIISGSIDKTKYSFDKLQDRLTAIKQADNKSADKSDNNSANKSDKLPELNYSSSPYAAVHKFESTEKLQHKIKYPSKVPNEIEVGTSADLSMLYLTGLSTSSLLKINPKSLALQVYLFHASLSVCLNAEKINYYVSSMIQPSREKQLLPSLLTIGSIPASKGSENLNLSPYNDTFKGKNTTGGINEHELLHNDNQTELIPKDLLLNTLFFTLSNPHFFTRLINYHLLLEIPKNQPIKRRDVLLHWIMIGEASRQLGDAVMWAAVALAVTSPPIVRLRETWIEVPINWKTVVTSQWIPKIIKYSLFPFNSQSWHNDTEILKPIVIKGRSNVDIPFIPYYGSIKNNIQKISESAQTQLESKVTEELSSKGGVPIVKYSKMYELIELSMAKLSINEKEYIENFEKLTNILSGSEATTQILDQSRVRSKSVPSTFESEFDSVFKTFILSGNEKIDPELFNIPINVIPGAQLYFRSLAQSPILFMEESDSENDGGYDLKYLLALSLQCEPSINDYYQEMLHHDLQDMEAQKAGISTQMVSPRTQKGLERASSAILPLVCPEIVLSTNILQWISVPKRATGSVRKKSTKKRYKTEQKPLTENQSRTITGNTEFPQLQSPTPDSVGDEKTDNGIWFNSEKKLLHKTPNLRKSSESTSGERGSIKQDRIVSPTTEFNNLNISSDKLDISTPITSRKLTSDETKEFKANSTMHILSSTHTPGSRRLSIPPKINTTFDISDFSKLSLKDGDAKLLNITNSSIDLAKTLASYVDSVVYARDSKMSFRVIRVQYASSESINQFPTNSDSRRSSLSNKRNSTFSSASESNPSISDTTYRPVGFFVLLESAAIKDMLKICVEGLEYIDSVSESSESNEPILLNNSLPIKLYMNHAAFLKTFLATYRQFCMDIDILNYIQQTYFDTSGALLSEAVSSNTILRILELFYLWLQLYPDDFIDNPLLVDDVFELFRKLCKHLSSAQKNSALKNQHTQDLAPLLDQGEIYLPIESSFFPKFWDPDYKSPMDTAINNDTVSLSASHSFKNINGYMQDPDYVSSVLSRIEGIQHLLLSSILTPSGFSSSEKSLSESLDLGKTMDLQLIEKKQMSMYLLSSPRIDIRSEAYHSIQPTKPEKFLLGNLSPMELLFSLNRLAQTYYAKCTPQDWHMTFCLLEGQTRIPLSWYSKNRISSYSDEETVISDVFRVLISAVRPSGSSGSSNQTKGATSSTPSKYLSNFGISLRSGFGNKNNFASDTPNDLNLLDILPSTTRSLIEVHNLIRAWTVQQIADINISPTERAHRICLFLYIIHLSRTTEDQTASHLFGEALYAHSQSINSSNGYLGSDYLSNPYSTRKSNLARSSKASLNKFNSISRKFVGTSAPQKVDRRLSSIKSGNHANRYVPSFVERAIASALVSPESRMFSRTWNQIAVSHHVTLSTLELMLKGVKDWSFDRWFRSPYALVTGESMVSKNENSDLSPKASSSHEDFFVPCVGWLLENFISLCYDSSDLVGLDGQSINFVKMQNACVVINICNYISDRCTEAVSLPVVQRINMEHFTRQVSESNVNIRQIKQVSNDENSIPLYSKPKWIDNSGAQQDNTASNGSPVNSHISLYNTNKMWALGGRNTKSKQNLLHSTALNLPANSPFSTTPRASRVGFSPQQSYFQALPQNSNRDSPSQSGSSNHSYALNNAYNSNTISGGHGNSGSSSLANNNRSFSYNYQFQPTNNSAVISLKPPFNKLVRDEQEKRRHEMLDRQKLEREYRDYRSALEKMTTERDKALKKKLKEQQQRNAKSQQLLKIKGLMNRVESETYPEHQPPNATTRAEATIQARKISGYSSNDAVSSSLLPKDSYSSGGDGKSLPGDFSNVKRSPGSKGASGRSLGTPRIPALPEAKPANVINLINSTISPEPDYNKRDFVFRIITEEGGQHLIQAPSESEMNEWISATREAAIEAAARRLTLFVQDAKKRNNSASSSLESTSTSETKNARSGSFMGFEVVSYPSSGNRNPLIKGHDDKKAPRQSSLPNTTSSMNQNSSALSPGINNYRDSIVRGNSFGINLVELMINKDLPPLVLTKCISEIELRGLTEVGIYRVSGSALEVSRLKSLFNGDPEIVDISVDSFPDINVVAGVLKQFLRELPEPLIPYNVYNGFIAAADIQDYDERLWAIKDLINTLPKHNFITLKTLVEHLERVTDCEEINHMYASNLALVFGPSLLHPPPGESNFYSTISNLGQAQSIVKNMILQYHWLFDAEEEADVVHDPLLDDAKKPETQSRPDSGTSFDIQVK